MRTLLACALATGIALLAAAAPPQTFEGTTELDEWIRGPVRYIARAPEAEAFKALEHDDERALFIERFWTRRDPSPETLTNEYRQLFWERVRQANDLFVDGAKPGWLTDRGKIWILYGAPNEVDENPHVTADGALPGHTGRGVIRWIYNSSPGGRKELGPNVVVPFVRDASGEYRLSYDPRLASVFFDPRDFTDPVEREIDRVLASIAPPTRSNLSVMLDLGRLQEVPPHEQVLLERVETIEAYRTVPIEVGLHRYQHPGERMPLVVVTAEVDHVATGTQPAVIARFTPHDATRDQRILGEDSFHVLEVGGRRLVQGRIALAPGRWDVTLMAADPATARTGLHRQTVSLPEPPGEGLRLSDVVLAHQVAPVDYVALSTHDEPWIVGPFRVVPRLGAELAPGEPIRVFYEVYGGRPPYRIRHVLEGRENDGRWVPLGAAAESETPAAGQAWEVATGASWPLGDYRVRVEVVDAAERLIAADVPFKLVAADPS